MRGIEIVLETRGLHEILRSLDGRAEKVLEVAARNIERDWKQNIVTQHVIDTGTYLGSVHVVKDHPPLERTIADGVTYGVFQEFGTSRMGARPCALPAVEQERGRLKKAWEELLK